MAIAVADILARVNQITERDLTSIDEQLLEACNEIALRTGALKGAQSGVILANSNSDTAPTDILSDTAVEAFYLDDEILTAISFEEFKSGKIGGYCIYNGIIYVNNTSDRSRDYTLYYYKRHGVLGTNLEFNDIYKQAIVRLTTAIVYDDYELNDRANYHRALYEQELVKLPRPVTIAISRKLRF